MYGGQCPILLSQMSSEEEEEYKDVRYEQLYSSVEEQKEVVVVFSRLLEVRAMLLEEQKARVTKELLYTYQWVHWTQFPMRGTLCEIYEIYGLYI